MRKKIDTLICGIAILFAFLFAITHVGYVDEDNIRHLSLLELLIVLCLPVFTGFLYAYKKIILTKILGLIGVINSKMDSEFKESIEPDDHRSSLSVFLGGMLVIASFLVAIYLAPDYFDDNNVRHVTTFGKVFVLLSPIVIGILYTSLSSKFFNYLDQKRASFDDENIDEDVESDHVACSTADPTIEKNDTAVGSLNGIQVERHYFNSQEVREGITTLPTLAWGSDHTARNTADVTIENNENVAGALDDRQVGSPFIKSLEVKEEITALPTLIRVSNSTKRKKLVIPTKHRTPEDIDELLRNETVSFTAYHGERAALDEANRALTRLLFERNEYLESYKLGLIRFVALRDKSFLFRVPYATGADNRLRYYHYSDYGTYYSIVPGKYDDVINDAVQKRDETEDLLILKNEVNTLTDCFSETFEIAKRKEWNEYISQSELFAEMATALQNHLHESGTRLMEPSCESETFKDGERIIASFIEKWLGIYDENIKVNPQSFNHVKKDVLSKKKISNYNRYCSMHKFNERFYACKYLPVLIPQGSIPSLEDSLKVIRKYGPRLIIDPQNLTNADTSVLARSPGAEGYVRDSVSSAVSQEMQLIDQMGGDEFEKYCVNLLKMLGYKSVKQTQKSWDRGADILFTHNNLKYVVQCKRHSNLIDYGAIDETCSARDYYMADAGLVMTNQYFTSKAVWQAKQDDITLWSREILIVLVTMKVQGIANPAKMKEV